MLSYSRLSCSLPLILCLFVALSPSASIAQVVPDQTEDGSAAAYTDSRTGEEIVPRIEERDGKKFYYWPHWGKWTNGKMHVENPRTTHPDAQWWPEAGLGLFLCWGLPTAFEPNGEGWSGRWSQARVDRGSFYPQTEIWAAAEGWEPTDYDPNKWMEAAAKAGFKYSVMTMKHHGGYAMWDSDHALIGVRQYMDGRDLVEPWVEACRANGIKVGLYYSGMDWYFERDYMNFSMDPNVMVDYHGEFVESIPKRPPSFSKAYEEFNAAQVRELMDKFDPDIWWGDGGHGMHADDIRAMKPGIVLNNRGLGGGDHATAEGWHMADPQYVKKPVVGNGWWWEVNAIAMGGSWHYGYPNGERIYDSDFVLYSLAQARSMGGNLLANIGPRPDGRMQDQAYRLFDDMAEWMETNRDSVFGINGGGPWPEKCNVPVTCRDAVWYFHARPKQATAGDPIVLEDAAEPVSVKLMRTGEPIDYAYVDGTLSIAIPDDLKAGNVTDVVVVDFGPAFDTEPYLFTHW